MDNKVVLCYLVKIGALTIRTSLIFPNKYEEKITINAECLPGHLNVRTDWESHNFQGKSDWKLSPEVFAKICQKLGTPSIDLFASRMSHQLPVYMGWKLDPGSQATNAMYQLLAKTFPYPFPPFSLILLVLSKLRKKGTTVICVAPIWQLQAWYSVLLSMYIHNPHLLPHRKDLLLYTLGKNLRLAAWLVSGNHWHQKTFQTKLQSLYSISSYESVWRQWAC